MAAFDSSKHPRDARGRFKQSGGGGGGWDAGDWEKVLGAVYTGAWLLGAGATFGAASGSAKAVTNGAGLVRRLKPF